MKLIKDLGTERDPKDKQMKRQALFYCEYCKNIVKKYYFHGIKSKSCGCAMYMLTGKAVKKHGDNYKNSRLYRIWSGIKCRCYYPKERDKKHYKDKDITVCDLWKNNYIIFKIWSIMHGYKDNLTIDRIDNNKGYSPDNCRWITMAENERNRSNNKFDWNTIKEIRNKFKTGKYNYNNLSKIYNTTRTHMRNIILEKVWIGGDQNFS